MPSRPPCPGAAAPVFTCGHQRRAPEEEDAGQQRRVPRSCHGALGTKPAGRAFIGSPWPPYTRRTRARRGRARLRARPGAAGWAGGGEPSCPAGSRCLPPLLSSATPAIPGPAGSKCSGSPSHSRSGVLLLQHLRLPPQARVCSPCTAHACKAPRLHLPTFASLGVRSPCDEHSRAKAKPIPPKSVLLPKENSDFYSQKSLFSDKITQY